MAPFVKLFDALNTPESLFIFRGTGRGGRMKRAGVVSRGPGSHWSARKKEEKILEEDFWFLSRILKTDTFT